MKSISTHNDEWSPMKRKISRFYDVGSPYYAEIYGEHIHDGYYITGKEGKAEAQENLTRLMAEKAGIKRGQRVLDVGCGLGGSSIWLAKELGAVTTGVTLSQVQVDLASRRSGEEAAGSTFLLLDAEKMHFSEPFDVIWVLGALTHFEDQEQFVRKAPLLLNRKGKMAIFDWMIDERVEDLQSDPQLRLILKGMLLPALFSMSAYLRWLRESGFRVICAEDITARTAKTWEDALSVVREPAIWKLAGKLAAEKGKEVFTFLRSLRAMKLAMRDGKVKAGLIVAETI
jgi:tocopherol O-methyltransferase